MQAVAVTGRCGDSRRGVGGTARSRGRLQGRPRGRHAPAGSCRVPAAGVWIGRRGGSGCAEAGTDAAKTQDEGESGRNEVPPDRNWPVRADPRPVPSQERAGQRRSQDPGHRARRVQVACRGGHPALVCSPRRCGRRAGVESVVHQPGAGAPVAGDYIDLRHPALLEAGGRVLLLLRSSRPRGMRRRSIAGARADPCHDGRTLADRLSRLCDSVRVSRPSGRPRVGHGAACGLEAPAFSVAAGPLAWHEPCCLEVRAGLRSPSGGRHEAALDACLGGGIRIDLGSRLYLRPDLRALVVVSGGEADTSGLFTVNLGYRF